MATVNGTRLSKGAGRAQRSRQSTQEQQAPEVQQRLQEFELASLTIGLQVQRARPAFVWPHFLQNFTDPSNTHSHTFATFFYRFTCFLLIFASKAPPQMTVADV